MRRSSSGISPVVATVILVAIAIVIAIAVAFWASGLVGVFTRFEKLEVTSAYYSSTDKKVVLRVRNTGSADASIDDIYVNGIPCAGECGITPSLDPNNPYSMPVGAEAEITIEKPPTDVTGGNWQSGVTYEILVHTSAGKSYPISVLIP